MSSTVIVNAETISRWIAARLDSAAVEAQLRSMGLDAESTAAYLKAFRKQRASTRQTKGFINLGGGAGLGFVSTMLTISGIFPGLFTFFLYGLTTAAVLLLLRGLYFIFE